MRRRKSIEWVWQHSEMKWKAGRLNEDYEVTSFRSKWVWWYEKVFMLNHRRHNWNKGYLRRWGLLRKAA